MTLPLFSRLHCLLKQQLELAIWISTSNTSWLFKWLVVLIHRPYHLYLTHCFLEHLNLGTHKFNTVMCFFQEGWTIKSLLWSWPLMIHTRKLNSCWKTISFLACLQTKFTFWSRLQSALLTLLPCILESLSWKIGCVNFGIRWPLLYLSFPNMGLKLLIVSLFIQHLFSHLELCLVMKIYIYSLSSV